MIAEFKKGDKITAFFVLRHKERRLRKGGEDFYLTLELGDASGRIFGSLWDQTFDETELTCGAVVKVRAVVTEWHGRPYLHVEKIRPISESDQVTLDELIPKTDKAADEMLLEFEAYVKKLGNPHLRELLHNILTDQEIQRRLLQAPGGKLWHHCRLGGLLEHTLNVAKIVRAVGENYPYVNVDLLTAGALLHDIGKVFEFSWEGFIDYADDGRLHGHIAIGHHLVAAHIDAMPDFPAELRRCLLHLILSHQGKREQGSPVVPMTREAFILYYADELDSNLGAFDRIFGEREGCKRWSNYVNLLDRFLYFGPETDATEKQ